MGFDERLVEARKAHGLNQEQLAEKVGVSRQAVSKWETGDAQPDFAKLLALADALEMSVDDLCGRENVKTRTEREQPQTHSKRLLVLAIAIFSALFFTIGFFVGTSLPSENAAQPASNSAITVSAIAFSRMATEGKVNYRFVPSVTGEGYTYTLLLRDSLGNEQSYNVVCNNGKCAGVIYLEADKEYSATVVISKNELKHIIPIATSLRIYGKGVLWD